MNANDYNFIGFLSVKLDQYRVLENSPFRANFRCPVCGDSKKSKTKARGWLLERDKGVQMYCHNCGYSKSLQSYLYEYEPELYKDYRLGAAMDRISKPEYKPNPKKVKQKKIKKNAKGLQKLSTLPKDHVARRYVKNRMIPDKFKYDLFYSEDFNKLVNGMIPNKMNEKIIEPRLIIPFRDKDGTLFGFQGRSFDKYAKIRYISIMLDETKEKVYGLERVDFSKRYYVFEGPIDSMFINNSVAMAGSAVDTNVLENIENAVFVFDNEPRNKEIVRQMNQKIEQGFQICLWGRDIKENDVNDMILSGLSSRYIQDHIDRNTYSGLEAKIKFMEWRKIK